MSDTLSGPLIDTLLLRVKAHRDKEKIKAEETTSLLIEKFREEIVRKCMEAATQGETWCAFYAGVPGDPVLEGRCLTHEERIKELKEFAERNPGIYQSKRNPLLLSWEV